MFTALPGYLEEKARLEELDIAVLYSKTAANELTSEPLLDEDVFVVLRGDVDAGRLPGIDALTLQRGRSRCHS